jgi:nucleoside-diphosphate-sugar epimerase
MTKSLTPASNVLITGVTGLVGGEIFRRLAFQDGPGTIWPLIRPTAEQPPDDRLRDRLARSGDYRAVPPRVRVISGDILEPHWGMSPEDHAAVGRDVDLIIHNAADTSFAPQNDPAKTNVASVSRLIELARTCNRSPLIAYMSTASNVGEVSGRCVTEDEGCQPENTHFNDYTHSKAVAESLLRESGLPVLVLRPTIVLSAGLPDPQFARQILWFVPVGRLFEALPLKHSARIDVVDVDFVAEATRRLLERPQRSHDCYHLSAGAERSVRLGQMAELVSRHYRRRTPLRLIEPTEWSRVEHRAFVRNRMQRVLFRSVRYYLPFLNMDTVYDDSRLRSELGADCPVPVPLPDYLCDLLRLIKTSTAVREAALP